MNNQWDLSVYYQSLEDPSLARDMDSLSSILKEGHQWLTAGLAPVPKLEGMITLLEKVQSTFGKAYGYCQLVLATDAGNAFALQRMDRLAQLQVDVEVWQSACIRYVGSVPDLENALDSSPLLAAYGFFLKECRSLAAHMLPDAMEPWLLRMSLSGGDAFSKLRDQLMGSHTVEINGKALPLPAVRGMAYDPAPQVRRAAYQAEIASYAKVELPMAYCLGGIKGEALTLAELRGYPDVLTQQLEESRMDIETLKAMLAAVRHALPDFRRYLRAKAKRLGHRKGLPFYDLFAPVAEETKRYTAEEAQRLLVDTFSRVHPPMGQMIEEAFESQWIDLYPKEGKEGGAFCAGNHQLKTSRILTNFVGSFSDVSTLAHELGHAWHNRCLEKAPLLMADPPMPLAETASIFNETLLSHTIRQQATGQEALALLEESLMEATQTVVDIYSRFLFEGAVLEARKTHTPTPEELNAMMLEAQQQAYGDGLDPAAQHPFMWICKPHYYTVGLHYYNFPYAFGLLFGLGVFAKYQQQGSAFMPRYDALLAASGSGSVVEVAASIGIDVHSEAYWHSALDVVRQEIEAFVAAVGEKV